MQSLELTWLTGDVRSGPARENAIPDLSESSDYNPMMVRRIELKEATKKVSEILLGVYLVLQYHLQHGMSEVQIRVIGVFLHRHPFFPGSSQTPHRSCGLDA